jgi:hypothetical protein
VQWAWVLIANKLGSTPQMLCVSHHQANGPAVGLCCHLKLANVQMYTLLQLHWALVAPSVSNGVLSAFNISKTWLLCKPESLGWDSTNAINAHWR